MRATLAAAWNTYTGRLVFAAVVAAVIVACAPKGEVPASQEAARERIGKIVDANVITTSFNEMKKTQVKTERMFVVVAGTPALPLGADAYLVTLQNGRRYLAWTGGEYLVPVW